MSVVLAYALYENWNRNMIEEMERYREQLREEKRRELQLIAQEKQRERILILAVSVVILSVLHRKFLNRYEIVVCIIGLTLWFAWTPTF